ncbi:hypothetical protein VCHA51O444_10568 [Vibrio chagasii]|nr:hypothetical protein VCHA51O444_10568 [Vibrio chagasii]CAH7355453.1 hypothetical protein VCHA53O474_30375 [Vibrio chagasii]
MWQYFDNILIFKQGKMVFKGYMSVGVGILKQLTMFETKFKLWHGGKSGK